MSVLVASDLDRTLIHSAASAADPRAVAVASVVEELDGRPASLMTGAAALAVGRLVESGRFVPVTTRTVAQTRRVRGPFAAAPLLLCANGGRLLRRGTEDPGFARRVALDLDGAAAPLAEVVPLVRQHLMDLPATGPARVADGLFAYAVLHDRATAERGRARVAAPLEERGWRASVQGRKLYAVPVPLSKATAAGRLQAELDADRLVAAGDSGLDADLLLAADAAIRPAHGELHEAGFTAPHLATTAGTGLAAGEEIALWLEAAVRS